MVEVGQWKGKLIENLGENDEDFNGFYERFVYCFDLSRIRWIIWDEEGNHKMLEITEKFGGRFEVLQTRIEDLLWEFSTVFWGKEWKGGN
jgi:hypothetical protein